jgi:hypothetical protein
MSEGAVGMPTDAVFLSNFPCQWRFKARLNMLVSNLGTQHGLRLHFDKRQQHSALHWSYGRSEKTTLSP